jgi:light-regulated signal transduction histidine kinase (bacteriophytochrome)
MALTDFTERKVTEIQRDKIAIDLFRQNKDLDQFAYVVSHNLRAPVANIIGLSKALERTDLNEQIKQDVQGSLLQAAMKLDTVIMDLNLVLQVKQKSDEKKTNVKFDDILNDVTSSIENIIEKDNVQIITDFSEVNEIITLKSYLYSIFYNIIMNSINYKQQNLDPIIYVTSKLTENKITLIFKDNGMGIDLKKKGDQVFKLYKRFHTDIEGKGMGLFMIKTQVESLNGSISIESEVNIGTELKIEFDQQST